MVDRFNGAKIGMKPTGSSRRESYKFIPVSRMTNTYIASGKDKKEDISATLIGKGHEVLKNIDMVSDNLELAEGMCGASSGSIPVCVGQPMLRVQNITVGGKN